jgi:hypothetical protein
MAFPMQIRNGLIGLYRLFFKLDQFVVMRGAVQTAFFANRHAFNINAVQAHQTAQKPRHVFPQNERREAFHFNDCHAF